MYTSRFKHGLFDGAAKSASLIGCLALASTACGDDPAEFRFGDQLANLEFRLFSENVGVHPFDDVLADPNNPFARSGVSLDTKFEILAGASTPGAWYAWATVLAAQPTGEHQFFTAQLMEALAATRSGEERFQLEQIAIRGYQAVLDFFPGDISFLDATLINSFRVVTPAYFGIIRLGGRPEGDWVVVLVDVDVTLSDGTVQTTTVQEVVQGSAPIIPEQEPETESDDDDEDGGS